MTQPTSRALVACLLASAFAAPAFAADLTGKSVQIDWQFPDTATTHDTQTVVVGPGAEVSCPGNRAGGGLCADFVDSASIDLGANTIHLSIDGGTSYWNTFAFNGYEFSQLASGGAWTGYTLATDFAGLDASRVTFTPDAVWVNMEGIVPTAGESFTLTLTSTPAVPEPANVAMLLAGLGALAGIARRKRA